MSYRLISTLGLMTGLTLVPGLAAAGIVLPNAGANSQPLTIRHHHVRVEIDNQVATTTVEQTFENHTDRALDGTFHFALPPGAAVVDFVQWIGDERVGSEMVEKDVAEERYEEQKRSGDRPALLQLLPDDRFQAKVSGIPAHGVRRTQLVYSQILQYEGGVVDYRYPFDMHQYYTEDIDYVSFKVTVRDQKKIKSLTPQGLISVDESGDHEWTASGQGTNVVPNQDLALRYEVESRTMGVNFLTYREPGQDGYFVLMIAPQELTTAADIVKKDVVFVFDTSGSMEGDKIEQAREALKLSLSHMNEGDGFSIIGFSSSVNPFRNKIRSVDEKNLGSAAEFVSGLRADGGTDIQAGLSAAFDALRKQSRPSAIVFLTDGVPTVGVTNENQILERVQTLNTRGTRLFTFGVGNDVNRRFLEEMGAANRGDAQFLTDGKRIDDVVSAFYASISKPVLADMGLDYGDVTATMTYPSTLPDIYKGQQLLIVGRYRGSGKTELALTGELNGETKRIAMPVEFPEVSDRFPFVPRVWAQHRIDHLLRQIRLNGESTEMKQEVIKLAKAYRIVTPYTSFVTKRSAPQVASLTPARIKPGDPEIWIEAPADAKRITVHFPFGVSKRAVWDARKGKWVVRFLIPQDTPDGVYFVRIAVTGADGDTQIHTASYTVDTTAPALKIELASNRVTPGAPLQVNARPAVTPLQIVKTLDLESLGVTVDKAEALVDVKTVAIMTEDGRHIELREVDGEYGWHGVVETLPSEGVGMHHFTVFAIDVAGNVWGQRVEYEVVASEIAAAR